MTNEKPLIDVNSLIEDLELLAKHEDSLRQSVILGVVHTIKARSTVDAVEVVRCKDCKYGEVDDADLPTQYLCNYHGADWNDENHFCSYGERKDGDGNG